MLNTILNTSEIPGSNTMNQVAKELERLSKFYTPENGGVHKEPIVVVDCHGQILLWYLTEVLNTERLVRVHSS